MSPRAAPGILLRPPLPPPAAGNWVRLRLHAVSGAGWWAKLELADTARGQVVREAFLGKLRGRGRRVWRETLLHVPREAGALELHVLGTAPPGLRAQIRVLGRLHAATLLLCQGLGALPAALAGDRRGRIGRLRAVLGQAPMRRGEAPPYREWLRWYEGDLANAQPGQSPAVLLLGGDPAARACSLDALRPQPESATVHCVAHGDAWPVAAGDWVLLLREGECLARGALAAFAASAGPDTDFVYADTDRFGADGERRDPIFKPGPGPALMRSGLLTTGACLVRWPGPETVRPADAEAVKLDLALRPGTRVSRIPAILTHLPADADMPSEMRDVTQVALARRGLAAEITATRRYLRVRLLPGRVLPRVTAVVASACRASHVLRCLRRVLDTTRDLDFELLVAVSSIDAADRTQAATLARLKSLPRLRIVALNEAAFNYAEVNNRAAAAATGDILLLLNDDVFPLAEGWLPAMLAHFQEPDVGAVGARLLYGNGMVQHGGVILGLAHLCEHADRLQLRDDPGAFGLSVLDREVSAVTAACMAVRAQAFQSLGGLDPGFAIALNDVDFCLRLRREGWRIVQCAGAELLHFESLSLGRHYRGERAALEAVEVRRLRQRWGTVLAEDPYYNPQASLQPGREWQPAFPPRGSGFSATPGNSSAEH